MSQKGVRHHAAWTIGTWSKKVKPSSVEKVGIVNAGDRKAGKRNSKELSKVSYLFSKEL